MNLNSIFTGSPDIAPRLVPTSNPNAGSDVYHQFDNTAFALPTVGGVGTGSLNYILSPGTFSNDVTLTKQFFIGERRTLELRASAFNLFNSSRFQDLNLNANYKMNGAAVASGYRLINSPEAL